MSLKCLFFMLACLYWPCFVQNKGVQNSSCPSNEMLVECGHCGPQTCDDLGYPVPCHGGTGICTQHCACVVGFVRNIAGYCIPMEKCPSCRGDYNATSGCGNYCANSCSDYMEVNKTCLTGCRYNSCSCKTGFVFNEALENCVLPADCFPNKIIPARSCCSSLVAIIFLIIAIKIVIQEVFLFRIK